MRWPAAGLLLSLALVLAQVAGCAGRPPAVGAAMPPEAVAAGAAAYPAPPAPFAEPDDDPFHARGLPAELAATPPGMILRYRPIAPQAYYFFDVDARAWQVAYRSTNSHGRPQINVATVLIPADPEPRLLSYQVAYDALTRRCAPSREILSGSMVEHGLMNKALSRGWIVVLPDYEGPEAQFLAGPNAGHGVLDGIRAARALLADTPIDAQAPVALWGYSGGAFASLWAAELAADYAPELPIAGVAAGGPPADLVGTARHIDGGLFAGLYFAAVIGLSRAHEEIDVDALLNAHGRAMFADLAESCVGQELAWVKDPLLSGYSFDTFAEYTTVDEPLEQPALARVAAANTLGQRGFDAPLLYYHARFDQVTPRADALALARRYCRAGVPVRFDLAFGEHISAAVTHAGAAVAWLDERFAGRPPPSDCASLTGGE